MHTWIIFVALGLITFAIWSVAESIDKLRRAWESEFAKTQSLLVEIRDKLGKPK